jgi:hypothetical protein
MNKFLIFIYLILIVSVFIFIYTITTNLNNKINNITTETKIETKIELVKYSNWDILIRALIWQESKGVNKNCLQITRPYIQELIDHGYDYKYEDVYDRKKSIQMFNDFNKIHNPDKNILRAIELHNPGGGKSYRRSVLLKYHTLQNILK